MRVVVTSTLRVFNGCLTSAIDSARSGLTVNTAIVTRLGAAVMIAPELRPLVMAIDPGLANGVCMVRRDTLEKVESLEAPWPEACSWVSEQFRAQGGDIDVVVETFRITPATAKHSAGSANTAIEVIGMVKLLVAQYRVLADPDALPLQTPADAHAFTDSAKLRELGWWHRGGKGHANMALRHAALRLLRTGCRDKRLLGL